MTKICRQHVRKWLGGLFNICGFLTFQGQVSLSLLMQIIFMSSFLSLMGNKFTTFSTNSIKKQKICSTNNIVFVYYRNSQFGTCVHILRFVLRTSQQPAFKAFFGFNSPILFISRETHWAGTLVADMIDFLETFLKQF